MNHLFDLGEYSVYIWLSYAVAAVIMLVLLWRTMKDLGEAEKTFENAQKNISGASLTSKYTVPEARQEAVEEC